MRTFCERYPKVALVLTTQHLVQIPRRGQPRSCGVRIGTVAPLSLVGHGFDTGSNCGCVRPQSRGLRSTSCSFATEPSFTEVRCGRRGRRPPHLVAISPVERSSSLWLAEVIPLGLRTGSRNSQDVHRTRSFRAICDQKGDGCSAFRPASDRPPNLSESPGNINSPQQAGSTGGCSRR